MFVALNYDKERIVIENADNNGEYFCPICEEKLSVKAKESVVKSPHFAHRKNYKCVDTWTHDMSEWHYSWQKLFPKECREFVIERQGVKHRADVFINNTVIEFQHSPITAEEIKERNEFYLGCGYHVVWIFDADKKIRNAIDKNGTLDPAKTETLEWKIAQSKFAFPEYYNNTSVFLDYSIETNSSQTKNILLLLNKIDTKKIHFLNTKIVATTRTKYVYIDKIMFLKEYGVIDIPDYPTISDVVNIVLQQGKTANISHPKLRYQQPNNVRARYFSNNPEKRRFDMLYKYGVNPEKRKKRSY